MKARNNQFLSFGLIRKSNSARNNMQIDFTHELTLSGKAYDVYKLLAIIH
jgi:hypothetical protein